MPALSSRGQNFGNFLEKADTTGLLNLLQSFRGREMGKGQKMSETLNWVATGVKEGGDRPTVREQSIQCEASARHTYVPALGKYRRCGARAGRSLALN